MVQSDEEVLRGGAPLEGEGVYRDSRRSVRYPAEIPVNVTAYIMPPFWMRASLSGTIRDISTDGTRIEVEGPNPLHEGQPIMVSFRHPSLDYPIAILARVVWLADSAFGVEFTKVYRGEQAERPGPWLEWPRR